MGFEVVFDGSGGVFELGDIAFVRGHDVVTFVDFLHVGGEDDCLLEFVAIDGA